MALTSQLRVVARALQQALFEDGQGFWAERLLRIICDRLFKPFGRQRFVNVFRVVQR